MAARSKDFVRAPEVVVIHLERYNRQIESLLAIRDYTPADVAEKRVDRREFYRARERRRKAYLDVLQTLAQKERLLQLHQAGFQIELIEEKIQIRQSHPLYELNRLSFEEKIRLYHLMTKAKVQQNFIPPITNTNQFEEVQVIEMTASGNEVPNVSFIKIESKSEPLSYPIRYADPASKLKESLNRLAAQKFKDVGTLTEDEEKLL